MAELDWSTKQSEGLKQIQDRVAIFDAIINELLKEIDDPNKTEQAKRFAQLHLRLNRDRKSEYLKSISPMLADGGRKNRSKTKRNNKRIKIIRNKYNKRTKNRRYKSKKKYK